MRRFFSVLFNRTTLAVLGLLVVAALVYWVGPIIAIGSWTPLADLAVRIALIALIVLAWAGARAWRWWRTRSANGALLNQLASDDKAAPAGEEEVAELRRRFASALSTLRKGHADRGRKGVAALFGRRYVYEMPWYMFIGAPGSGKTTALVNSGLEFPLAEHFGKGAIRGVGGTRNCDWWFTNQAVLLDTAGRYTTQESNEALDKAEWDGFLALLRKYRPRAPINGVMLTASVADLLGASDDERERHAIAVRRRLAELYDTFNVRFPVYVVVTKTDLLAGFDEYFQRLSPSEREQVWGFTFALDDKATSAAEQSQAFRREYALLQKRIEDALPDLLQAEPDLTRRALAYAFPQQFAGLHDVLDRLLGSIFTESKFAQRPLLRGVYFTSGTQEGTPFDRVLGSIQRRFGVEARVGSGAGAAGTGKSYFIKDLLQALVFPEAHLVTRDPARERRRKLLQIAGIATIAVALCLATVGWVVSYSNNRNYLTEVAGRVPDLARAVEALPNAADSDATSLLPILNGARDLARSEFFDIDHPPLSYQFGLYRGKVVAAATAAKYEQLLETLLLPRVAYRLTKLLEEVDPANLGANYLRLKAYLMLHDAEHYRPAFLVEAVAADWQATLGQSLTKETQRDLLDHLHHLLDGKVRLSPLPLDEALVKTVRDRLGRYTQAKRIYDQLKESLQERVGTAQFTLQSVAGPTAPQVFSRASGESLNKGVNGLFTRQGYTAVRERLSNPGSLLQLDETWVLGRPAARSVASKVDDILDARIVLELRTLYLEEYRVAWDRFLADVQFVPTGRLSDSIRLLREVSGPDSPLTRFVKAVADETSLAEYAKSMTGVADRATAAVKEAGASAVGRVFGNSTVVRPNLSPDQSSPGQLEKRLVDDYFEMWRRMATAGSQSGGDSFQLLVKDAYDELIATEEALRRGNPPPAGNAANKLRAEAARLPTPLRGMFEGLGKSSSTQTDKAARDNVGAELEGPGSIGEFCRKAIAGRYPFVRRSDREVELDEFVKVFGPGGKMDEFFQRRLAALVNTSTKPWSYKATAEGAAPGTSALLQSFQQAVAIKEAFFLPNGTPQFRLQVKLAQMDAGVTGGALDIDGQALAIGPAAPRTSKTIGWPVHTVSLRVEPAAAGAALQLDGPWALHRWYDRARIAPGGSPDRFLAEFNAGGRTVAFEISTGNVYNQLNLRELQSFRCPSRS